MSIEKTYEVLERLNRSLQVTAENLNARNSIDPYDAYFKRNMYGLGLSRLFDTSNTIDIMTEKSLYGLVNFSYRPVNIVGKLDDLLNAGMLRRVTQSTDLLFAVNFVADAFDDFALYYKSMIETGKINTSDKTLGSLNPVRGWTSPHNLHERVFQVFYEAFVAEYLVNGRRLHKIKNFHDFLIAARGYFREFANSYPFTRSGITRSIYMDPACSGLMIELGKYDSSDDAIKVSDFWSSPNFDKYKKTAEHFGFRVDKNSPWRLVANLTSRRMERYMGRYNIAPTQVFDALYTKTNTIDLDMIKVHLLNTYNNLVATKPSGIELVVPGENCSTTATVKSRKFVRRPMSFDGLQEKYSQAFWYDFYYELRLLEESVDIGSIDTMKAAREAESVEKAFDNRTGVAYIEDLVQEHVKAPKV